LPELEKIAPVISLDLPGFGNAPALPEFTLDAVLEKLATQLPPSCVLVGWSLGGMLAMQMAARLPQQVKAIVTIAANLKFVASSDYPAALAPAINNQFARSFESDPQAALKLFGGLLAQGDAQERQLLKSLRQQLPAQMNSNWGQALGVLAALDNRDLFINLQQPGMHLLGEKDALVPAAAVETMRQLNPQQQVELLPETAHAIHWSQPELFVKKLRHFLSMIEWLPRTDQSDTWLDKKKVAQSFSRAASTYDSVAGLQRAVGNQLLMQLSALVPSATVLDLGSGTGFFTAQLAQDFSQVIALDIAEGMLHFSAQQHPQAITWICGDAESLPLKNESVDIIFSSLAIQWCNRLPQLMTELCRVLKPGGQLLLSTLGPKTLHELKAAWQSVDNYVHVNRFQSETQIREAVASAGLQLDKFVQEDRILYFEKLVDLTHELKALGAHNMNQGQATGLTGRQRIQAFKNAYEKHCTPAGLPATYEVFYVCVSKSLQSLS
jgi:malonyl-CoA O-methyltransferase